MLEIFTYIAIGLIGTSLIGYILANYIISSIAERDTNEANEHESGYIDDSLTTKETKWTQNQEYIQTKN